MAKMTTQKAIKNAITDFEGLTIQEIKQKGVNIDYHETVQQSSGVYGINGVLVLITDKQGLTYTNKVIGRSITLLEWM